MAREGHANALREVILAFLGERLQSKLDKLKPDDPVRDRLREQFQLERWVGDAARRVSQLQVITYNAKATYPDAHKDKVTSLFVHPKKLPRHSVVGGREAGENFVLDVIGNSAVLDVFAFLKLECNGKSLWHRCLDSDSNLAAALSDNTVQAQQWMQALASITESRSGNASHTRTKQVYWLTGADPTDDADFHLLAPLYATSLAHRVFQTINDDRFSEASKAARKARREGLHSETGYRDYPNLAVQKLGGTKPQNISQLNSERGGRNYLLASLPPNWESRDIRPPFHTDSVFARFGRRRDVLWEVNSLRRLLDSDPRPNLETRQRRDEYVACIIEQLMLFAGEFLSLEPGWSADPACRLVDAEALWLDAGRADLDPEFAARRERGDWTQEISHRFGNWLNDRKQLGGRLPMGDPEHQHWMSSLQEVLPYV